MTTRLASEALNQTRKETESDQNEGRRSYQDDEAGGPFARIPTELHANHHETALESSDRRVSLSFFSSDESV